MKLIKVIIVGEYGLFVESLITRLNKEACETFAITGIKQKDGKNHKGIIEEYNFEYDNNNVPYILESTKVDVVIFTGALDAKFSWDKQNDAVAYISGLYNVIISASRVGVKRFIYISSTDVYEKVEAGLISEGSPVITSKLRTSTIRNGEDIVLRYAEESDMQVVVLRCSEAYGFYNGKVNMQSFCTKLSLELIRGDVTYIDKYQKHDYIHVSDVVEAVYNTLTINHIPHRIYNICSGACLTEDQTIKLISKQILTIGEVKFIDDTSEINWKFSCELAKSELGLTLKYSFEDDVIQFIKGLKEYVLYGTTKKREDILYGRLRKNLKSILGWFFPYLETVAAFIFIQSLVSVAGKSTYLEAIDFYLLFVVFIAIIYGKGQTTIALLLCLFGKIIILKQDVTLNNIVVDYNTYLWILQLLVVGMGIGYIRDQYKQLIGDKEEDIEYLRAELAEIKDINHSNIRIKKIYESRLINYQDSFARIYSIISKLGDLEPDKIMFMAVDVVAQIMNSNNIAIYSVEKGSTYARLTASSTNMKYVVKKSIRLDTFKDVYDEIKSKKIYVNRKLESDKPSLAGGVFQEDKLKIIIIIWSLPFENTTLYHMNLFSVVLNLISQALYRANYHIEENKGNRYLENTNILTKKSFKTIMDIKKLGFDTNLAEYYVLEIIQKDKSLKQVNDVVVPVLRQQDYLGVGENDKLYLLLTNTNENESEFVISRLLKKGIETRKETLEDDGN